ncbi:hypothetical protein D1007_10966 [Hordeum vulgare]|nr:hypothetical protein D1007_10966 [Hordeum vulgare]
MVYEDESSNNMSNLDISSSSDGMQYRILASIEDEDYMGIEISALDVCSEHRLAPERRVAFEGFETGRRFLVCAQPNCGFVWWVDPEWPPTMQNALLKLWEMLEDDKSARRNDNLESSLKIHHLTEEKRNLDANYDKLVEDVNQLLNAQEERVMDFSYLQDKVNGAERSSVVVAIMKTEIEKKEAEKMELQGKYSVLMNLLEAQGRVIRNQKANHLKEKEKLSEENYNLKVQVDKLDNFEEKLKDDIGVLNLHIGGLKKGMENRFKRRDELKLEIADQLKAVEKNQEKLKMTRDILDG